MLHSFDYINHDIFLSFQQGEERGFNYFFELHYKQLMHFAYTIVQDREIAKDVVEDSFVKLWEKRESISSEGAIKPYLFTSVRNNCINVLRREKYQKSYRLYIQKTTEETAADITQKIITSESMNQVFLALQNLPSKYRKIINMLYLEEKPVKEIARELNLPLSTVKSQKSKALELLKKQLPHLGTVMLFSLSFLLKLLSTI